MSQVAGSGRTVLFVSHNFAAVAALTHRSIVLEGGRLIFDGPVEAGLAHYTSTLVKSGSDRQWGRGKSSALISAELIDREGVPTERFVPGTPLRVRVVLETTGMRGMTLEAILRDQNNLPIAYYSSAIFNQVSLPAQAGRYECILSLDAFQLAAGEYGIDLQTFFTQIIVDHRVDSAIRFSVDTCSPDGIPFNFRQDYGVGPLAMKLTAPFEFIQVGSLDARDGTQAPLHLT
jgi:lipopolysaccharide transport system ATP-binding protein